MSKLFHSEPIGHNGLAESGDADLQPQPPEGKAQPIHLEVEELYHQYAQALLQYARTFTSDGEAGKDAVQEAFLRFSLFRLQGKSIHNPKAWLYKVLRNYMLDWKKSFAVRNRVEMEEATLRIDPSQNLENNFQAKEDYQWILTNLSERELECLRLKTAGFDYREMAELMEISPGTVGSLLNRAITKISKRRRQESK